MNNKFTAFALAALALTLIQGALVPDAKAESDPVVTKIGNVSYISGGVGAESIERINTLAGAYDLKLVFALTAGNYVSDVRVAIADARGNTLLMATSEGPWFLVKLPAGNYRVVATYAGQSLERDFAVGTAKPLTVDFRWSGE
jgi:hypothetical protein